jgi:ATP-dependent DNA ligase
MRKSEYSKHDSGGAGQRAPRRAYPTLMPRAKKGGTGASPVLERKVIDGAVPAEKIAASFPRIALPIIPPYPPMEARSAKEIPSGQGWLYEPKWDGFRCIAFRKANKVILQSKAGQPLGRYFPELVEGFGKLPADEFVLDGEIIVELDGYLSFDALLQRIHPAESRMKRLASETPSSFLAFDLLVGASGESLIKLPLRQRRAALDRFARKFRDGGSIRLSPASEGLAEAERWMRDYGELGCDGVIAKRIDEPYHSGDREAMVKIKRLRTADCVVGGFRYAQKGGEIGSLLLGLFDENGKLNHVGFSSSFSREERKELKKVILPLEGPPGFTGSAPGGPSRWATERSTEWQPLQHKLVCEVQYDHFSGGRFRHGTKFLRWRPDKKPRQCTYDQLAVMPRAA